MKFEPHLRADSRRESATALIKMLLANNTPKAAEHIQDLIDTLLWRITEADGKYNTRYRTSGAIDCSDKSQLRHEHVCQRSRMITLLMNAKPEEVDGILKDAVGCVVTRDEHTRLKAFDQEYGWERYRKAGLRVMDTSKHPPQPKDNWN
jgi:hypothetical protein